MLPPLLLAVLLLLVGALAAALLARFDRASLAAGTATAVLASAAGITASVVALLRGEVVSSELAWTLPVGTLRVGIDPLSAFFLLCVFTVSGLAAIYGAGYLEAQRGGQRLAPAVAGFNVLVAAMAVVVLARDGILLIAAWEVMSVASFLLVNFEHDRAEVRRAGLVYLIASQLGVVFLFLLVALLGDAGGAYDFDSLRAAGSAAPALAGPAFLLALVGFGTKAGFWPVHLWLPDAHPAAPSHVSAVMSGVMIKMGIYGLLRTLTFLGPPPAWWGALVIGIGAVSGILGVLQALAQHDLKRLLAYHSVENIGIITLGIGLGLLGQAHGLAALAFLGYGGALLHVLNHGLFKSLLFEGAGSVLHATGERNIDRLGGLSGRMPVTAAMFLVGSMAICGLPPLNGFVSEWLIYIGAFRGGALLPGQWALCSLAVVAALALIGGLAAACFLKAYGVVFLGTPRTEIRPGAHDPGLAMRLTMLATALLCAAIGLFPVAAVRLVTPAVGVLAGTAIADAAVLGALPAVTAVAAALLALAAVLAWGRARLLARRKVAHAPTWGCGYAAPTPRMQYTASSFAQPVLEPFAGIVPARIEGDMPHGYFPATARLDRHIGDPAGERFLLPAIRGAVRLLSRVRVLQHGRVQLYLAYILLTLVVLLVWQLSGMGGR
ncbi:MAG: proton-conducting transporter membrane subunit [Hyphomicrobiales bacterium]